MSFALLCSFLFTFNVSVVQWLYMQWVFKVGAKSLQCSIKNRYIQRTMFIWFFFERSILAHLKNSLNDTDSNTQKVWWIIWEASGLPTRDTIYMLNMMIENKIYSITLTCKTKWCLKKLSFVLLWCILLKIYQNFSWQTSGLPPRGGGARALLARFEYHTIYEIMSKVGGDGSFVPIGFWWFFHIWTSLKRSNGFWKP